MKNIKFIILFVLLTACAACATVADNPYIATFTCTGSQGPFPFTYSISDPTAMTVTLNGSVVPTTGYTIQPVNNNYNNGGNVTLGAGYPCTASLRLTLERDTPITQLIQYYDNMPVPVSNFGRSLDKVTEILQELEGSALHIQMQNDYNNFLAPSMGDTIFNFVGGCQVSGTQNNYIITCQQGGQPGSGNSYIVNAVSYSTSSDLGVVIAAAQAGCSGCSIGLPAGRFTLTTPVVDNLGIYIVGNGSNQSAIACTAGFTGTMFTFNGALSSGLVNVGLDLQSCLGQNAVLYTAGSYPKLIDSYINYYTGGLPAVVSDMKTNPSKFALQGITPASYDPNCAGTGTAITKTAGVELYTDRVQIICPGVGYDAIANLSIDDGGAGDNLAQLDILSPSTAGLRISRASCDDIGGYSIGPNVKITNPYGRTISGTAGTVGQFVFNGSGCANVNQTSPTGNVRSPIHMEGTNTADGSIGAPSFVLTQWDLVSSINTWRAGAYSPATIITNSQEDRFDDKYIASGGVCGMTLIGNLNNDLFLGGLYGSTTNDVCVSGVTAFTHSHFVHPTWNQAVPVDAPAQIAIGAGGGSTFDIQDSAGSVDWTRNTLGVGAMHGICNQESGATLACKYMSVTNGGDFQLYNNAGSGWFMDCTDNLQKCAFANNAQFNLVWNGGTVYGIGLGESYAAVSYDTSSHVGTLSAGGGSGGGVATWSSALFNIASGIGFKLTGIADGCGQFTSGILSSTGSPCGSGGGGSGAVVASPQYQMAAYPSSGTTATVQGSGSITTDSSGNLNVSTIANLNQVIVNGTGCIGGPPCSFYENYAYANPWHPAGSGITHMEAASGTPYGYFDPAAPGSAGNIPYIVSQYSDSGVTVNVMGFENIPSLANVVYSNQANTYTAGSLQTVASNSSSAGFRDVGTGTDPPCNSSSIGSLWANTTYSLWSDCTGFTDNASPVNYLVDRYVTQANVDGSNQAQYHFTPAKLAAIELATTNQYSGNVIFGDSDSSGFGVGQLSWIFSLVNQLQDPGSGFNFAGYGFVTSDAVGTGLQLNALPTGVTGNSSGSWTKCYVQDGVIHNAHSGGGLGATSCLGLDNVDMTTTTSGAYQQYTAVFTNAFCFYATQSGGGTDEVVVDGTPVGTSGSTTGTSYGEVSFASGAVTEGSHVLRCQTTNTGNNTFTGALLLDTTQGKGTFFVKAAAASNSSIDFAGNTIEELTLADMRTDIKGSNGFNNAGADFTSCGQMWGANEYNQNIPTGTMITAMTTINTNCHTALPYADLPLMSDPDDGAPAFPYGTNTLTMKQYDDAIRSTANGLRQPSFSALSRTYPQALSASQGLYASDNIHLSVLGQRVIANAIANEMTPSGRMNQTLLGGGKLWDRTDSQTSGSYTIPASGGPYGTGDWGCAGLQASALYKDGGIGNQTVTLPASTAVPPTANCYFWFTNANTAMLTMQAGSGTTLIAAAGCTTFAEGEGGMIWFESPATYRLDCMKSPSNGGDTITSPGGTITVGGTGTNTTLDVAIPAFYTYQSGSQTSSISAQTLTTPSGNHLYEFKFDLKPINGGTGCTGTGSVTTNFSYTDADSNQAISGNVAVVAAGANLGTATTTCSLPTSAGGLTASSHCNSIVQEIYAKTAVAVQVSTTYTAGSGCSAGQAYALNAWLELVK